MWARIRFLRNDLASQRRVLAGRAACPLDDAGLDVNDFFTMSDIIRLLATRIVDRATNFVGLSEVRQNAVWDDKNTPEWEKGKSDWLRKHMARVKGWEPGAPYCAAFDGAVVATVLDNLGIDSKPFLAKWTAHVMTNVRTLKGLKLHSEMPTIGSLWLARFGDTDKGHAGIVVARTKFAITTVEGNTMKQAGEAERERQGDGIWIRQFPISGRGELRTQCFCSCDAILALSNVRL